MIYADSRYLIIFLKFMGSVIPTIEHDNTMDFQSIVYLVWIGGVRRHIEGQHCTVMNPLVLYRNLLFGLTLHLHAVPPQGNINCDLCSGSEIINRNTNEFVVSGINLHPKARRTGVDPNRLDAAMVVQQPASRSERARSS